MNANLSERLFFLDQAAANNPDVLHYLLKHLNSSNSTDDLIRTLQKRNYWQELNRTLGPRRGPLEKVISITTIYGIILLCGIFGNISTCLVIGKNKYMHTPTNYYLFNLAIADLLVLLFGLPFEIYSFWSAYPWIFGKAFCHVRNMTAETTTSASILTITAFTVERYIAFCHPTKVTSVSSLSRVVKIIIGIWVISGVSALPLTLQFDVIYTIYVGNRSVPESALCKLKNKPSAATSAISLQSIFAISTSVFFVVPMSVISVLYILIAIAIRRSTLHRTGSGSLSEVKPFRGECLRADRHIRARKAVVKMLVAVVVVFFICWSPFHAQRLMAIYVRKWTKKLHAAHQVIYYVSGILYYVSTTINPVLYNIMSVKFRQAFRTTLLSFSRKRRQQKPLYKYTWKHRKEPSGDSPSCLTIAHRLEIKNELRCGCSAAQQSSSSSSSNSAGVGKAPTVNWPFEIINMERARPKTSSLPVGKPTTESQQIRSA